MPIYLIIMTFIAKSAIEILRRSTLTRIFETIIQRQNNPLETPKNKLLMGWKTKQ